MYLVQSFNTTEEIREIIASPFGPAFTEDQVSQAEKMELWGSGFEDEGQDFCEFRLIKDNEIIFVQDVDGY